MCKYTLTKAMKKKCLMLWKDERTGITELISAEFSAIKKMDTCMAESLCCPPETLTATLIGYKLIKNKKVNNKINKILRNGKFYFTERSKWQVSFRKNSWYYRRWWKMMKSRCIVGDTWDWILALTVMRASIKGK